MTFDNTVLDYIMTTPYNTNLNIVRSMLGEGDWEKVFNYIKTTPRNMNRMVLESLLKSNGSKSAVVGTAIVGESVVG